ncbi:lambda-exonuclease family protein [Pseudoalteromonas sp.]|uniref:lambda-exonuclease family protein n=1 Tax=Pseudoalteromonas sp. TaxID=53249 RepID=UPI003564AF95
MYKIIDLEQNTPEWLAWREGKATASQSPSVMGESKYFPHTPYEMYLIATGQAEKPFYNKAMQRGHEFEDEALQHANRFFDADYKPLLAESELYKNFAASLDGFDPAKKLAILEIKTTKEGGAIWNNGLEIYHWQLTHQCAVMGVSEAMLYAYDPDTKTAKPMLFKVKDSDIKKLVKAWNDYFNCINNFEIPALTDRDYIDGEKIEGLTDMLEELREIKRQQAELKNAYDLKFRDIVELCGDRPTKINGCTISRTTRKGNVNYKNIPELYDVDLDKYRGKPTTFWTLREPRKTKTNSNN